MKSFAILPLLDLASATELAEIPVCEKQMCDVNSTVDGDVKECFAVDNSIAGYCKASTEGSCDPIHSPYVPFLNCNCTACGPNAPNTPKRTSWHEIQDLSMKMLAGGEVVDAATIFVANSSLDEVKEKCKNLCSLNDKCLYITIPSRNTGYGCNLNYKGEEILFKDNIGSLLLIKECVSDKGCRDLGLGNKCVNDPGSNARICDGEGRRRLNAKLTSTELKEDEIEPVILA